MMKNAEHGSTYRPLQQRVMINLTKEDCGRGGEVKFQKYSEWNYKNYFRIVERRWFDMKNLENYASGMDPHKFSFDMESLNSLSCFWACEYVLWRRHTNSKIASFVFQDLKYQRENGVSKMITRAIRRHL